MMREIKPPTPYTVDDDINGNITIFLAGSIEMGIADNWQKKLVDALSSYEVTFFNPRRDDWDSSWVQSIDNPQFVEQVEWELDMLDRADYIIMYFDPNTKSPISLLELGLHAKNGNMIVCCPEGFWRKGNVEIVCDRFKIPLYHTVDEMIAQVINALVA